MAVERRSKGPGPATHPARRVRARQAPGAASLDRLIHERARLGIMSALAAGDPISFNTLKAQLGLSDGNLSVHTRKLEEAGYLACHKSFAGRTPLTEFTITAAGRSALRRYVDHMEAIIATSRKRG